MINSLRNVDKDGVLAIHTTPQNRLGEYFCDNETNELWVYLQANNALSRGAALQGKDVVTFGGDGAGDLVAAAAGSRKLTFESSDLDGSSGPLYRVPTQPRNAEYAIVYAPGTDDQFGTVYEHRDRECSVEWWSEIGNDLSLTTALAADTALSFVVPWLANEAGNTDDVIGFAQRDISAGQYFWALVEGLGIGQAGAAIAAGTALRVTGSAGRLDDVAEGSAQAVNACAHAKTAAAADGDEFLITACAPMRISIPQFKGGRSRIAYQHPAAD